jgi:hypothetical protein
VCKNIAQQLTVPDVFTATRAVNGFFLYQHGQETLQMKDKHRPQSFEPQDLW